MRFSTRTLVNGFFLISGFLVIVLAFKSHWSDSELWSLGISQFFPFTTDLSSIYKPLFSSLLKIPFLLPIGNEATIHFARLLFAFFSLGTLLLFFQIAEKLSRSRGTALFCSALLVSSPFFLSQSYQIRSDLLALFFQLLGILHFLSRKPDSGPVSWKSGWTGFLIHLAILLSTPKGVFHVLVNFTFIWFAQTPESRKQNRDYLVKTFAFPAFSLALFALWKHTEFISAVRFFAVSYLGSESQPGFFSRASTLYVSRFFIQHWLLFALLCFSAWILHKKGKSPHKALAGASAVALFLILFHSDRLPFFIYSLMPMPMLFAGITSSQAWAELQDTQRRSLKIPLTLFLIWGMVRVGTVSFELIFNRSNQNQIQTQQLISQYLRAHPDSLFYDGTIALPRNTRQLYALPAPSHPGNLEEVLSVLDQPHLDLVFFGNKMFYYFQALGLKLEEKFFIRIGNLAVAKAHVMLATQPLSEKKWQEICTKLGEPPQLYAYEGNGIFMMEALPKSHSCSETAPQLSSRKMFLAFSAFAPIAFPAERSFAEIFDQGRVP